MGVHISGRTKGEPASERSGSAKACAPRVRRRQTSRLRLAIVALGTWTAWEPADVLAQRAEPPRITVAPTIVAAPASQALLPIEVGPPPSLPANSFVRVRGLPLSVSLTDGHAIGPGSWAVPLFGLPMLKANVPAGVSGRTEIVISLISIDGALLAETRTVLVVEPAAAPPPPPPRATVEPAQKSLGFIASPPPIPSSRADRRPQPLLPEEKARAERLLARGEEYFVGGNVAAARDFFERAAEAGLPAAALRLAASYDPTELQGMQVQGVVADRALARKWYERARELGAPEAVERLARLGGS